MGKLKSYYFNEINGLDEAGNPLEPYPTEEEYEYDGQPDEQQENQDFAQDGEFENQEGDERL